MENTTPRSNEDHAEKVGRGAVQPVFVSGLPRSGSTLLTNLLALHPAIEAAPTSPLYPLLEALRHAWSEEETLLAQLDADFSGVYERMQRSLRAFALEWCRREGVRYTLDKHRGWLQAVETVEELFPDFRMIVCLRDLRDVYASIERRHARTRLLTFPGRLEQNLVDARANQLFAPGGLIGGPLRSLYNLVDVPWVHDRLHFWRYERFVEDPQAETGALLDWLGVERIELDPEDLRQSTHETDSHYHFKFPHRVQPGVRPGVGFRDSRVSPRVVGSIAERFAWFYRWFYRPDGSVRIEADGAPPDSTSAVAPLFSP